jgi:hypothetical protein
MAAETRTSLQEFFKKYDPAVQRIVRRVISLEQRHIDSVRPRVKDEIRQAIEEEVLKK